LPALVVAALTVTDKLPLIVPSEALTVALCASYSTIAPPTDDTPLVNVIAVALPKAVAVPELFVTVGTLPPGELLAPEKVRLLLPV
jgi:hypothetical protein